MNAQAQTMPRRKWNVNVVMLAKERHDVAQRLVERLEMQGAVFAPHPGDTQQGWIVSGNSVWQKHGSELTEFAAEIASILNDRAVYISKLAIVEPKHKTLQ